MYGKLIKDKLEYAPNEYIDSNGETIYNFNKSISTMKKYGYKPVIDIKPKYNFDTQYCKLIGYTEDEGYIRCKYEVVNIEPTKLELKNIEMKSTLKTVAEVTTDDKVALQLQEYYDLWCVDKEVPVGKYIRHKDVLYKVLTPHITQANWTPDNSPSLFAKVLVDPTGNVVYEWVQPDSTNPYMKNDKVLFNGVTYISIIDNNVWQPDVYGWEVAK